MPTYILATLTSFLFYGIILGIYFPVGSCTDNLPSDYGTVEGGCGGGWICPDWAGKGSKNSGHSYCDEDWSSYMHCVPQTTGLISEYCRLSCDKCGKSIISSILRYINIIKTRDFISNNLIDIHVYFPTVYPFTHGILGHACCLSNSTFHERCRCLTGVRLCGVACKADNQCKGYVGETDLLNGYCELATTSDCATIEQFMLNFHEVDCEKLDRGNIGSIDNTATCGKGYRKCAIKMFK